MPLLAHTTFQYHFYQLLFVRACWIPAAKMGLKKQVPHNIEISYRWHYLQGVDMKLNLFTVQYSFFDQTWACLSTAEVPGMSFALINLCTSLQKCACFFKSICKGEENMKATRDSLWASTPLRTGITKGDSEIFLTYLHPSNEQKYN